jgi:hypothetical protein
MRTIVIQIPEQLIERVHRRLHLLLAQYETERVVWSKAGNRISSQELLHENEMVSRLGG